MSLCDMFFRDINIFFTSAAGGWANKLGTWLSVRLARRGLTGVALGVGCWFTGEAPEINHT